MNIHQYLLLTLGLICSSCSSATLHGSFVSNEKNIWIEDIAGNGLSYCLSNADGSKAEPVCYAARKGIPGEAPPKAESSTK